MIILEANGNGGPILLSVSGCLVVSGNGTGSYFKEGMMFGGGI